MTTISGRCSVAPSVVGWPNGKATVCKTVKAGSIPAPTSNLTRYSMEWIIGGLVLLLLFSQRDTMPDAQNDPTLDDKGFRKGAKNDE